MIPASINCRTVGADGLAGIERKMAIVETVLQETFPHDFFRRCAFAAFALLALLEDAGVAATLVGGRFGALVMTPDRQRQTFQGFESGPGPFPHLWVETQDRLIDLGPHLLAFGSAYPVVAMPALIWDLATPLPAALRYKPDQVLPAGARFSPDQRVSAQCDAFVDRCRAGLHEPPRGLRLPTWVMTNYRSLRGAAERRDPWALGARRFERAAQGQPLPF